jgi:hypothetical protein
MPFSPRHKCVFRFERTTRYIGYFTINYMSKQVILCWSCNNPVTQYYSDVYKGERARCSNCNIDFPLE